MLCQKKKKKNKNTTKNPHPHQPPHHHHTPPPHQTSAPNLFCQPISYNKHKSMATILKEDRLQRAHSPGKPKQKKRAQVRLACTNCRKAHGKDNNWSLQ